MEYEEQNLKLTKDNPGGRGKIFVYIINHRIATPSWDPNYSNQTKKF